MIFNTIINHLRHWCLRKAEAYQLRYKEYGGDEFVGYLVAYELEFKILTLIDKSFENEEALRIELFNLVDIHYDPSIVKPRKKSVKLIINKINRDFCEYCEELLSTAESRKPIDLPYTRVIVGFEADLLKNKYHSIWKYDNNSYWFPLRDYELEEVKDKFFVMAHYFEPYIDQTREIINLPQEHIYCYGENTFRPEHCIETSELYDGLETIYTDKKFSWAIYFSHESTVSFAGSIVPKIQKLLSKEKSYWNKWE